MILGIVYDSPWGPNGFLWSDWPIPGVSLQMAYVGRVFNIVLAAILAGLCVSAMRFAYDSFQKARFMGLGIFCLAMIYGTFSRMGGPATPRLAIYTVAAVVSLYGLIGWLQSSIVKGGNGRNV